MYFARLFIGLVLMIMGLVSVRPSDLDMPPNTATLVFLAGAILVVLSFKY